MNEQPATQTLETLLEAKYPELHVKLKNHLETLRSISEDSPRYERYIREQVVTYDTSDDAVKTGNELSETDWQTLSTWYKALVNNPETHVSDELPFFFICFEWCHRNVHDQEKRHREWKHLLDSSRERLDSYSIWQYAASRYYSDDANLESARNTAREALRIAPSHIGFTNNFAEILLSIIEPKLIGSSETLSDEDVADIEFALEKFEHNVALEDTKVYPSFHVSMGRLYTCKQNQNGQHEFDKAFNEYTKARELAIKMYNEHDDRMKDQSSYVIEMSKIITAESNTQLLKNAHKFLHAFESIKSDINERSEKLDAKVSLVEDQIDNQKLDMLNFLGFFSGIISFIVASIQIGDDMDFVSRAMLLIIMLGTLLVAFGALNSFIERKDQAATNQLLSKNALVMILVGVLLILLGVVLKVVCFPTA